MNLFPHSLPEGTSCFLLTFCRPVPCVIQSETILQLSICPLDGADDTNLNAQCYQLLVTPQVRELRLHRSYSSSLLVSHDHLNQEEKIKERTQNFEILSSSPLIKSNVVASVSLMGKTSFWPPRILPAGAASSSSSQTSVWVKPEEFYIHRSHTLLLHGHSRTDFFFELSLLNRHSSDISESLF